MTTAFQEALLVIRRQQELLEKGDEETVKEYVIKPLALTLGWHIFDQEEFYREYPRHKDERVDYSLRICRISRIFVEAKRWKLRLKDDHRDQLHRYCLTALRDQKMAANGDIPRLGVLTNGRYWRFYVAPDPGNHKLRQMRHEINIIDEDAKWLEYYFSEFLARDRFESDEAIKKTLRKARMLHKKFVESITIRTKLTRAWNSLIDNQKRQENLLAHFASSHKI